MKSKVEYVEGHEAFKNFDTAMRKLVTISRDDIKSAMDAERRANAGKPKRGPKPKTRVDKTCQKAR